VAQGVGMKLGQAKGGSQRRDHVVEGTRHQRFAGVTGRFGHEDGPVFVESIGHNEGSPLVIEVVVQRTPANR